MTTDRQARVDRAIAEAQSAIDQARKAVLENGRLGLRQLAAMLDGELQETRTQTARCYSQGQATHPKGEE